MERIVSKFEQFMRENGQYYQQYYVGIASNPIERLSNGHGVTENIPYVYWNTPLHTELVRAVEKYFLDKGCKGGPGGGDNDTNLYLCVSYYQ